MAFNKVLGKYRKGVENIIKHRIITGIAVVVGIVVLVFTMSTTKTGLVPNEDTGTLFVTISLPPATSQERYARGVNQVDEMLANNPMIQSREQIAGYNFIAGQGSDQATFVLKLKPFEERTGGFFYKLSGLWEGDGIMRFFVDVRSSNMILGTIYKQISYIKGARIYSFRCADDSRLRTQ